MSHNATHPPSPSFLQFSLRALCACMLLVVGVLAHAALDGPQAAGGALAPVALDHLDLQRYSGRWYELARLPNSFQRKCAADVTADYRVGADGHVRVVNQCTREDGSVDMSTGEARRTALSPTPDSGMLQVRFAPQWLSWLPAVWGDYWVLALDADYETALVGSPDRQYLWLLSRAPRRPEAEVVAWLQKAADMGFAIDRVLRTAPAEPAPPTAAANRGTFEGSWSRE